MELTTFLLLSSFSISVAKGIRCIDCMDCDEDIPKENQAKSNCDMCLKTTTKMDAPVARYVPDRLSGKKLIQLPNCETSTSVMNIVVKSCIKKGDRAKRPEHSVGNREDGCQELPLIGYSSEICWCFSDLCNDSASFYPAVSPMVLLVAITAVNM